MTRLLFVRTSLLLIPATLLLALANGRWIFPLAAWVAPVFWLRVMEKSPRHRSRLLALAAYIGVFLFVWQGLVPAPPLLYIAIVGVYAIAYFVPYLIHVALAPRLPGVGATLVFPTAWISVEFLLQRLLTPYGTWVSPVYSQVSSLPLVQMAALTGTWGITFLMMWIAAVAAAAWRAEWNWSSVRIPVMLASATLIAVLLFGSVRVGWPRSGGTPVRVAALVPDPALAKELSREVARFRRLRNVRPETDLRLRSAVERLNTNLIDRTRREAAAGAKIVAWSETAARVLKSDEPVLLNQLSRLAADTGVNLLAGYGVYDHGKPKPLQNRLVAIGPDGGMAWTFDKAHPITGAESAMLAPGDGRMRVMLTENATITAAICHDYDFPPLIRQSTALGATLLVAPSADWPQITSIHAGMALLRAVENGIPLLRPTSDGRTLIADALGRTLAQQDPPTDAVVATVTPMHIPTIYGRFGDYFAWICLASLVVLAVFAARTRTLVMSRLTRAAVVALFSFAAVGQETPLAKANAALDVCVAAARKGDEAAARISADEAERLYDAAERASAPIADVLTGRARILSQCRLRFASRFTQPSLVIRSNRILERALAVDPQHLAARFALAMNHYYTPRIFGQTANALSQLEWIVNRFGTRRDPLVADAYLFLGRCYKRLEREAEAQAMWRRGAELFPAHEGLRRAINSGVSRSVNSQPFG